MSGKKKHGEPENGREPEKPDAQPKAPPEPPAAEDPLAEKTRECEELLERLKRTTADYLNYQKRMERRLEEVKRFAVRDLLLDVLPVIDNFERALAHAEEQPEFQALLDGIRLVHDQLLAALRKHGVERIEAEGKPFDPEHHEAVAQLSSEEHPEGHVAGEMQAGYRLHDQTLRPSQVAVSSGMAEESPAPPDENRQGEPDEDDPGAPGAED
jgi:molecular chaperone GrpE